MVDQFHGHLRLWTSAFHRNNHQLTSQEMSTALRPFYFIVHPDRFWRYPQEKEVNENSLKILNEHLENIIKQRYKMLPLTVKFYIRKSESSNPETNEQDSLKAVHVNLNSTDDVNSTVFKILSTIEISTDYLKQIGKIPADPIIKQKSHVNDRTNIKAKKPQFTGYHGSMDAFWMRSESTRIRNTRESIEEQIRYKTNDTLLKWMKENIISVRQRLDAGKPIREDINKLLNELKDNFEFTDIRWDSSWNASHYRACLISLKTLSVQHREDIKLLKNKNLGMVLIS